MNIGANLLNWFGQLANSLNAKFAEIFLKGELYINQTLRVLLVSTENYDNTCHLCLTMYSTKISRESKIDGVNSRMKTFTSTTTFIRELVAIPPRLHYLFLFLCNINKKDE